MAESKGPVIAGVAISFAILSFVVICLRLFARIYVLKRMGLDDCKYMRTRLLSIMWLTYACRSDYWRLRKEIGFR